MLEIESVALKLNSGMCKKKSPFHSSAREGIGHRLLIQNLATDNEDFGHVEEHRALLLLQSPDIASYLQTIYPASSRACHTEKEEWALGAFCSDSSE